MRPQTCQKRNQYILGAQEITYISIPYMVDGFMVYRRWYIVYGIEYIVQGIWYMLHGMKHEGPPKASFMESLFWALEPDSAYVVLGTSLYNRQLTEHEAGSTLGCIRPKLGPTFMYMTP